MKLIKYELPTMVRKGLRGGWITIYFHRYTSELEPTERLHAHPWKLAISIQLTGYLREHRVWNGIGRVDGVWQRLWTRFAPSIEFYRITDTHRILQGTGRTVFIGFFRTQVESKNATVPVPEGYAHWSELTKREFTEHYEK